MTHGFEQGGHGFPPVWSDEVEGACRSLADLRVLVLKGDNQVGNGVLCLRAELAIATCRSLANLGVFVLEGLVELAQDLRHGFKRARRRRVARDKSRAAGFAGYPKHFVVFGPPVLPLLAIPWRKVCTPPAPADRLMGQISQRVRKAN